MEDITSSEEDQNDNIPLANLKPQKKKNRKKRTTAPFQCEKCLKTFQKKHRLEAHLREHLGLKV